MDLRLIVNTQTPLVRLRPGRTPAPTTGGVTRMLRPWLKQGLRDGTIEDAEWVALAGDEDALPLDHDGIRLSFVPMPADERAGYAQVKEQLWSVLNATPGEALPGDMALPGSNWRDFASYQSHAAQACKEAGDRLGGADLLYVHDFQQIGVGRRWEGPRIPKVFHLHTPFPSTLSAAWRDVLVEELSTYDVVITSTQRYAANLVAAGLTTPIEVIRPFIDPTEYPDPPRADVALFREQAHIKDGDRVILSVGRMDPMKGQDRLLRALPRILERVPEARLVLVGNGSFSSSKSGGLGLSKGAQWRAALEALARDLRVEARVTFTGHLEEDLIPAAYASAEVFALPSTREGFGLAVIEAWRYRRPVVVSDRAGVAELVEDGVNGYALDAGDPVRLADTLVGLLEDPAAARALGARGHEASDEATLPRGARHLARVFAPLLAGDVEATIARA